jgi:hypothetical protein
MLNKKALAASVSAPPKVFVEDVFSTYLYTGTGANQTIINDIDLAGKGGMVWIKGRSVAFSANIVDTVKGANNTLVPSTTAAAVTTAVGIDQFNSNGFTTENNGGVAESGETFCSWTFREQAKFFDAVSYTGTGSNTTILHDLGSVPGMIIVKRTDTTGDWQVYHRANTANPETDYLVLNTTAATADSDTRWNDTLPTSTVFSLGTDATVNASGGTYIAYLFAHDAGGFGTAGTDNVISCGSFTGESTVTLGYEPQWIIVKRTQSSDDWYIVDTMRNWSVINYTVLRPNTSGAEQLVDAPYIVPTATGFTTTSTLSGDWIYMAIRRPMKVPTTGTSVFSPTAYAGDSSASRLVDVSINPDMFISAKRSGPDFFVMTRLIGVPYIRTRSTAAEESSAGSNGIPTILTAQNNKIGFTAGATDLANVNATGSNYVTWSFSRRPKFMDVVCYTGTGSATTQTHNLGVTPELMIVKRRSATNAWAVYANNDNTDYLVLNTDAATADDNTYWNDTTPTSTVFSVGTNNAVNASASTYVAYLFATLAGVSKVGSYTGTAAAQTINCGFTGGARFVLIKRTDSTGDWYVWDTARGIISGDDPYFLINSSNAEVTNTDYVDPVSSGFELSSTAPAAINASGGSFIFFAVA